MTSKDKGDAVIPSSSFSGYDKRLLRNVYVLSITMGIMTLFFGWQQYLYVYVYSLGAATNTDSNVLNLQVGIFIAVGYLAHALSGYPASMISDRSGRKKFVITGTFINGFVYMSYALFNTWVLLIIPMFIQNLVHAAYINPMNAMLAESAPPEKRGIANGAFQGIAYLISIFAPFVALIVILHFGQNPQIALIPAMPYLFLACGGTVVLMAIARGLTLRETHTHVSQLPAGLHTESISGVTGAMPLTNGGGCMADPKQPTLRDKSVVSFYIFVSLVAIMSAIVTYFIPIYGLTTFNLRTVDLGIFFVLSTVVAMLVQLPAGRLADSSRKKTMLLASVLLYAMAVLLYLRAADFNEFLLATIPFSAAGALLYNTEFTMIACYSTRRNRSRAFSIQTAINDLASIPSTLVGALLLSVSPQLMFTFGLVVTIPAFIVGALFVHEPPKPTGL